MDIVDAHQHLWDLSAHEQPWLELPGNEPLLRDYTEEDLRPLAEAAGVSATVVVQTVAEPGETPELLAIAACSDLIAAVVGWVDLQADDVADAVDALLARPDGRYLCGIRHPVLIEEDPGWLRRPAVHRGLRAVGAAGLCYDLVIPPDVLPAAAAAVAACPGVTFVLDHLGNPDLGQGPDPAWVRGVTELASFNNCVCKLSGVLSEAGDMEELVPYYEIVLDAFGPGRLMFGSDWPPCTLSASYASVVAVAVVLTGGLSDAEQAQVLGGTARRVYGLGQPAAGSGGEVR